mgnify:CR=1 FL=1
MAGLDDLRRELARLEKSATAKISRNRRKGIELGGSEFDPRIGPDAPGKRHNRRQLERAIKSVQEFNNRNTQFTALSGGVIAPSALVNETMRNQRRYNRKVDIEIGRIADVRLPNAGDAPDNPTGMTVGERDASLFEDQNKRAKRATGEANRRLYEPMTIKPQHIASVRGLELLNKSLKDKLRREYKPENIERQRKEFSQMMKKTGNKKAIELAARLTDHQFDILWNYGNFATDTSRDYERIKKLATGGASAEYDKVHEDATADIMQSLQWATFLPEKPQPQRRRR